MCGLFGVMSNFLSNAEIERMKVLGYLSVLRGGHATGIAVAKRGKKTRRQFLIHKDLEASYDFLNDDLCDNVFKSDCIAVIGHCRQPTVGCNSVENAHPHRYDHVIGAHNGTILSFNYIEEDKKEGSDSRVLFKRIAAQGLLATLKETGISGAYAISYFDTKNGTINFIRNKERPLWFMYNNHENTVYWASERVFLDFLRYREGKELFKDPWLLKERTLVSVEIGDLKKWKIQENFVEEPKTIYTAKFPKLYEKDDYYHPLLGGGLISNRGLTYTLERTKPKTVPVFPGAKNTQGPYAFMYVGVDGLPMELEEANAVLCTCCEWCQESKDTSDIVWWLAEYDFICDKCMQTVPFAKQYIAQHAKQKGELVKVPINDVTLFKKTDQHDFSVSF